MTLIPMISALSARRAARAPAGGDSLLLRGSYDPGAGHRPLAAVLAIGLPAALVVAVALSPMIAVIKDKMDPTIVETVPLPTETEPPVDPAPQNQPTTEAPVTVVKSPLPTTSESPPVFDPLPPYVPPAGTGSGPTIITEPAPPPAAPKLVLAQLDQRFLSGFQPDYPAREQREGIEGVAKVRVLIGADGKVKQVELVSTDSPGFFDATKRRALAKWRFKPATRGGVAEESWKEMTVRFEIRNA
jgi:protein TonB